MVPRSVRGTTAVTKMPQAPVRANDTLAHREASSAAVASQAFPQARVMEREFGDKLHRALYEAVSGYRDMEPYRARFSGHSRKSAYILGRKLLGPIMAGLMAVYPAMQNGTAHMNSRALASRFLGILGIFLLTACGNVNSDASVYEDVNTSTGKNTTALGSNRDTVGGDDGLFNLFGKDRPNEGGTGIGVNNYLWRASLDTISFMPLASADPFGGVIITDWYTPPETPAERFKMNVYILGRQLRADGVRVAVFRQNRDGNNWIDATVTSTTSVNLENEILNRARQLRFAARADTN